MGGEGKVVKKDQSLCITQSVMKKRNLALIFYSEDKTGADLGGGCRGCIPPPPPRDDLRFSNTTGILQKKKTMWFIGVEVEQETSAPPPKKNPGSAPAKSYIMFS